MENEQGVASPMGSMEVARQPCQARSHSLVERKKIKLKSLSR